MARKRKSQKQAQEELLSIVVFGIGFYVYYLTKSLTLGVLTVLFFVALFIIYFVSKKKAYQDRLRRSGIHDIDKMDGVQFERYLEALFKKLGYKATGTKASNDYGADLVLINQDKIVVQAKRHKNKVGIKAVQEIISAKAYYKAQQAWVVTNSHFTKQAINLAQSSDVKLIDREQLQDFILKVNPNVTAKKIRETVKPKEVKCPKCGHPMAVRKNNKNDEFFGCSQFPRCRYTRPIAK